MGWLTYRTVHDVERGSNLDLLLQEIKKVRAARSDAADSLEVREGLRLAVQLAELLHRIAKMRPSAAA